MSNHCVSAGILGQREQPWRMGPHARSFLVSAWLICGTLHPSIWSRRASCRYSRLSPSPCRAGASW